mmetsp:Transcript_25479/g.22482  ORF Transcript_25479/g.22482 Transcript_25479/m.22482 type:complete len:190 (-) Transcript_25479:1214-1783(-)
MDMNIVIREYQSREQNPEKFNFESVDDVVHKLKFFSKLSKHVRHKLLKVASYLHCESNDIVFRQGDFGDLMYIILRGSVNVRIRRKTFYGKIEDIVVAVLYDGSSFGELSMMGASNKKKKLNVETATIKGTLASSSKLESPTKKRRSGPVSFKDASLAAIPENNDSKNSLEPVNEEDEDKKEKEEKSMK